LAQLHSLASHTFKSLVLALFAQVLDTNRLPADTGRGPRIRPTSEFY
jgi:hypothetical protein